MSTFIRCLAISIAATLSVLIAQRLIQRAYKRACEKYAVVPAPEQLEKSA
ncbi:MAG: hypothetical protein FWE19_03070 [Oscillospiraceae bacterium]|nr:hypothetical protein [Oscillospiraceae bacterium]